MAQPPTTVVVETKSAWYSKINWTQAIGLVCSLVAVLTANRYQVSPEAQGFVGLVVQAVTGGVTWWLRTFQTKEILDPSLSRISANSGNESKK